MFQWFNLELSYNRRALSEIDSIFNKNFTETWKPNFGMPLNSSNMLVKHFRQILDKTIDGHASRLEIFFDWWHYFFGNIWQTKLLGDFPTKNCKTLNKKTKASKSKIQAVQFWFPFILFPFFLKNSNLEVGENELCMDLLLFSKAASFKIDNFSTYFCGPQNELPLLPPPPSVSLLHFWAKKIEKIKFFSLCFIFEEYKIE